ncbi:MAG: Asp-tRNA(Asn)/Glu-tRNA(Gln) amidotransferase subunit GatA [Bacillota bacterium]
MKLYEMTAHELSGLLRSKEISVTELTETFINRIEEIDGIIGSYINVLPDIALKQARVVENAPDSPGGLPPLAGIPSALKDNICTKGIPTTCASKMLESFIPPYNATVVDKLGARRSILLGKLNMDEFAMGGSNENSYFKITRNPWNTEMVPGGSSGGAAASVAAGMAVFALGSDTGGSIRQPAAFCGVVGMKPTYGLVSRYGLVAFASSFDQIGPIARDVTDCALVLNAIAGYDRLDSTSARVDIPDYTAALGDGIKGMRIGIPQEYTGQGIDEDVKKAVLDAIETFADLGAICEECRLPLTEYAIPAYYIISSSEASSNLARYDGIRYGYRPENCGDLYELYIRSRSEGFGTEVKRRIMLGTYALSSGYYDAYYKKALQVRTLIKESFDEAFSKYDLLIGPTAPTTAYRIGEKIDDPLAMYMGDIFTVPANIAGIPALSIPCGFDRNGLPIGLQLIGKAFDESTLLKAGFAFEQSTDYHLRRASVARG